MFSIIKHVEREENRNIHKEKMFYVCDKEKNWVNFMVPS
jgi:hypothetical protein